MNIAKPISPVREHTLRFKSRPMKSQNSACPYLYKRNWPNLANFISNVLSHKSNNSINFYVHYEV